MPIGLGQAWLGVARSNRVRVCRIENCWANAINLAKLHRAGELTLVWVPDQAHEHIFPEERLPWLHLSEMD